MHQIDSLNESPAKLFPDWNTCPSMIGEVEETCDIPNPRVVVKEFLVSQKVQGKVIFAMIGGSTCYNLSIKKSDFDFLGVYVAEPLSVLGMTSNNSPHVLTSKNPDMQIFEVSRFCELLITTSPVVLQMIFTNRYCYESDVWLQLKKNNLKFISNQTFKAYCGHAKAELKKVENSDVDWTKPLYHAFRLFMEIEKMAIGEPPRVHFDGEDREFILGVRQKERSREEYMEIIQKKLEFCEHVKNDKMLKSIGKGTEPYKILDDWLIQIRLDGIKQILNQK
jgi:predicted nucleotidyltransferase